MSNDYKFKLGLALARERELTERVAALEFAVREFLGDAPHIFTEESESAGMVDDAVTRFETALARGAQKYDDTLVPFTALMRKELHANSHKGDRDGWLGMTSGAAINEVSHHGKKLAAAVARADVEAIKEHAADVANCAMMVADVCGVLGRA